MSASITIRTVADMDVRVTNWVRVGLAVVLAPPLLVTGIWAVAAPRNWYERFPGLGPRLVAAEPPYNAHLATDAGAGFLAVAAVLLAAAISARRSAVYLALVAFLVHAVPHIIYHAAEPAPGLSGAAQVGNVVLLVSGAAAAVVLAWGASRRAVDQDANPTAPASELASTPRHTSPPSYQP